MSASPVTQSKQNATGSRLAFIYRYISPKMLLSREFYLSGLRGGALTFVAVLSILALYSILAAVSVANVIRYIRTRRSGKGASTKPPGNFELNTKPAGKAIEEEGPNMDEVQEIPGEMELAMLKDVMPADDLIPEIDSSDDEESARGPFSDEDTTLVNREDLAGLKNTEAAPVPVTLHKDDVERPISPPATPPARFATAIAPTSVPQFSIPAFEAVEAMRSDVPTENKPSADEEPTKMDQVIEKVAEITAAVVEEAAKAVEEHARIVEEIYEPSAPAAVEAPAPVVAETPVPEIVEPAVPAPVETSESQASEASPMSEFIVVPEHTDEPEVEAPIVKEEPAKAIEVAPVVESPKAPSSELETKAPVVESTVLSEEPAEEPVAPVVAAAEPESTSVLMAEPESLEPAVEEPKPIEAPKPVETPKRQDSLKRKDSLSSMNAPKSLGRPRVMRRATGSTAAVAGVTTSPAPATTTTAPIAIVDDKGTTRDRAMRRADDALSMLAGSILRSNTSDRMAPRPSSPATLPRSSSPANVPRPDSPSRIPRSGSPAGFRSESPSSETAGSRPASPALGMSRRGSIALANGARPNVSRQSSLANVTNAPATSAHRQQSSLSNSTTTQSQFTGRRTPTFTNVPRGGSVSPPPMPPPPQRQSSVSRQPTTPQAAVTSPSILSRKATTDSNGSTGSPPTPARRPISPARPPAEEFTTSGSTARRRVPFPSASDGGQQPINAAPAPTPASRQRPRPRKSTSGGTSAPNTLQASLLANLGGPKPPSTEAAPTASAAANSSAAASPVRRDSFASAVSNRDSILSFSDRSDMDMSDLDFSGGEGHRVGVKFPTGAGASDDEGMSGNEEEKRKRRARRRSKARTLSLKKQKRGKRN